MRTNVYVVVAIELEVPEDATNEDIDDILTEMDYDFSHTNIIKTEIMENQYNYQG